MTEGPGPRAVVGDDREGGVALLERLVALGEAQPPTAEAAVDMMPLAPTDGVDVAAELATARREELVAYDERLRTAAGAMGLPTASPAG